MDHPKVNKDPLHGLTLKTIVSELDQHFGWESLSQHVNIKCFKNDPSLNSSLKFLRKTDWARKEVETLYIKTFKKPHHNSIWKP